MCFCEERVQGLERRGSKPEETRADGADAAHTLACAQTGAAQPQWQGTQIHALLSSQWQV